VRISVLVSATVICAFSAAAEEWAVLPESSSVTMYAVRQGMPFGGVFREFTATIDFDPDRPEAGRLGGIVETGSIETGDAQNDTYILGFLEVEAFAEARFESTAIERTADGYRATGDLTVKDITEPATLDFTFTTTLASGAPTGRARISGRMTVNRFDYDIASELDTIQAGQDVVVLIELDLGASDQR
jgi:polyisoprenoid-binding protein YceI